MQPSYWVHIQDGEVLPRIMSHLLFAQVLLDVPHALLLITSRDAFPETTSSQVDGFSLVNCNLSKMSDASAQQLVRAICACNPCIRSLERFGLFTVTSMTGMRAHDHPSLCHHHRMSFHLTNTCSTPRVKVRSIATDVTDNEVAEVVCSCGGVPLVVRLVADALACGRLTVQVRALVFPNERQVVIS